MSLSRVNRCGLSSSTSPKKSRSLTDTTGIPSPVKNLTGVAVGNYQVDLTWEEPDLYSDSVITGYEVTVIPSSGTVSISGTTASVTGLNLNTAYTFDVRAINSVGGGLVKRGGDATTTNWNDASGGTVTVIDNYNGSGEVWKVHSFTASSTFTVSNSTEPFRTLVIGGGGKGGNEAGGGGGGGKAVDTTATIPVGNNTVTIGGSGVASSIGSIVTSLAGGGGGSAGGGCGGGGGASNFGPGSPMCGSYAEGGGGGGGAGSAGSSINGGYGLTSDITGTSANYAGGGGGGTQRDNPYGGGIGRDGGGYGQKSGNGYAGAANTGGGGGGGGWFNISGVGGAGGSGRVVISYRIQ